jgi:hypothetical protein
MCSTTDQRRQFDPPTVRTVSARCNINNTYIPIREAFPDADPGRPFRAFVDDYVNTSLPTLDDLQITVAFRTTNCVES